MSCYLYDEALVEKINKWTSSSDIHVYGPSETRRIFELVDDLNNDSRFTLPMITISRDLGYTLHPESKTKRPLSYDGYARSHDETEKTSKIINMIPISIVYQIDVYTRLAEEADVLMRNLIFNIINYPAMEVEIPDADFTHTARIQIASDTIQDNSNMPERFIEGNMSVLSVIIAIDDARLWDVRQHRDAEIEIKIDDTYETRTWDCLDCNYVFTSYTTPVACPKCGGTNWKQRTSNSSS